MATFEDAQAGWNIYRDFDFTLSLDEINDRLNGLGFAPVSHRTYTHYQKLRRYGYQHYLPINQLDVKTLQNPVWDAATRNRYGVIETRIRLEIQLRHDGDISSFRGEALQLSEGILAARFRTKSAFSFFETRARWKDRDVLVIFQDSGEVRPARLEAVTLDLERKAVNLRMSFVEITPLEKIIERETLGAATLNVVVTPERRQDVQLSSVVEDLWWLLQALETSRVICQDVLLALDRNRRFILPSTKIRRLRLDSPLDVLIDGGIAQVVLVYFIARGLLKLQAQYWTNQLLKEKALRVRAENVREEIRATLDVQRIVDAVTRLVLKLLTRRRAQISQKGIDEKRLKSLIEKQLQVSVQELGRDAKLDIELDSKSKRLADSIEAEMETLAEESDSSENDQADSDE